LDENLTDLYETGLTFRSNRNVAIGTERDPNSHWLGNRIAVGFASSTPGEWPPAAGRAFEPG
jgi:hypothetical protein